MMFSNPLEADQARELRIRERAYHLWQADGEPAGGELEYWERARELVALEDSAGGGQLDLPQEGEGTSRGIVEEASIQENLGEFPGSLSDQGDRQETPRARKRSR